MNGVWIIPFILSTAKHIVDERRQDEEHIATFETTQLASTTEIGKEHSIDLIIYIEHL